MDSRLNTVFEAAATSKKVPGIAAIALDRSGNVLYKGAFGTTNLDDTSAPPITSSTPFMIWSCTKLVTCVAGLQLVEQGKIKLDDPVEKYVPEIAKIEVLDGFEDGKAVLRAPKTKPTILNLMTHTSGFTYDLFDKETLQWRIGEGHEPAVYVGGARFMFDSPFLFDPGTKYSYGVSIDWLGFVIEKVSGMTLSEYTEANIFKPLGMSNTGPHLKDGQTQAAIHHRGSDGSLTGNPAIATPPTPEIFGGGHFLLSTLDDYSTFLLALLNNGTHPKSGAQILKKETVEKLLFEDQIPKICPATGVGVIDSAIAPLTSEGEFFPSVPKGWSCGMLMNLEGLPKGRKAQSGAWAGLGNLYYWIDPEAGKLGLLMSAVLPFLDKQVLGLFDELERAVYGHEAAKEFGEEGSSFKVT